MPCCALGVCACTSMSSPDYAVRSDGSSKMNGCIPGLIRNHLEKVINPLVGVLLDQVDHSLYASIYTNRE